jgi:uncharacterized membrane protein
LENLKTNIYFLKRNVFDRDEMIESIALSAPGLSPVPPSVTNKFSSKVENAVFQIENQAREYHESIRRIARDVANITFLIDTLNHDQRFVINAKYLQEHKTWVDIAREYQRMKDINFIGVNSIRRIRDEAVLKMLERNAEYESLAL